ncbi:MAG: hypothetical protein AAFR21_11375 [Pseudomonadota bacterium]
MNSDIAKLLLAITLDILDFTIGRMLGAGTIIDLIFGVIAVIVWGPAGLIAFWELLDPSEQVDGFVPTMTIIAISQMGKKKKVEDE